MSILRTRAQKSRAQAPEPIPKPHRPRHSKPRHSSPNAGHSHRKRQFCVVASLLLCGLFFWKSLPQDVNRPVAQSAADSVPTVLASTEPQPRYITESIERLRIGDMVLAMDPATGEIGHHRVVDHFQRTAYELRVLEFIGSDAKRQRIETTDEHPFFVLSEGDFIPAAELQIGDQCPGPQGEIQTLVATRLEPRPEGVPVFNFGSDGAEATGTPSYADANALIRLYLDFDGSGQARDLLTAPKVRRHWPLPVPPLLLFEVVNGLQRLVFESRHAS